ncbi:DUF2959 domain-containing protein [Neptunomonas phycophila]|uniref:DUF2959 domain-containing protein n=1 Tax=Neptunomonas phycophila TaxID=1572645 RepID=UPI0026E359F4|nr:DUF2959 domain-containing protein [Neptunomonas phycophila]MDO6468762.1 DUF2959 domain-containing protein [Neptunomonas phycophila]
MTKRILVVITALISLSGCQSAYYAAMEKVGVHKRDILVDRVEEARDAQDDAQEQFADALAQYQAVIQFDGAELETLYNLFKDEYDDSAAAAQEVTDRINQVEQVAEALFDEWTDELSQYQNAALRAQSAQQLKSTQRRYNALLRTMRQAEKRMAPVLSALNDNVLYLKHNLNARAIGALKGEFAGLQQNIDRLISDMERAIQESDAFIRDMETGQ